MSQLSVLIDYDNVESTIRKSGPMVCAKAVVGLVPPQVLAAHDRVRVRLYGGWRSRSQLTRSAQALSPTIQAESPTMIAAIDQSEPIPMSVELAEGPMGTSVKLAETLATDRGVRGFRAKPEALTNCVDIPDCGLSEYFEITDATPCNNDSCDSRVGDLFVRNEQKMVDTLMVADMAHETHVSRASHIVVASSDSDIWPGILLSLAGGTIVVHVHPKKNLRTPMHLMQSLSSTLTGRYIQLSV